MSYPYNGSMKTRSIETVNTQPAPPVIKTLLGFCQTIAETARKQVLGGEPLSSKRFPPYPAPAAFKPLLVTLKTHFKSVSANATTPNWLSTLNTEHPFLRKNRFSPLLTIGLPDQSDIPLTQYTFLPPEQTKKGEMRLDPALLEKAIYNFTNGLYTYLQARNNKLLLEDWCYLSMNLSYITLGLTHYCSHDENGTQTQFLDEKKLTLFKQFLLLLDMLFSDDALKLLFTNDLPETHKIAFKIAKSTLFKLIKESKKIQIVELNQIISRYPTPNIRFSETDCQHLIDAAYHASNKKNATLLQKKQFFIASLQKKVKQDITDYFNHIPFTEYKQAFAEFSFSHYLQIITRDGYYFPIKRIIDSFIAPIPRRENPMSNEANTPEVQEPPTQDAAHMPSTVSLASTLSSSSATLNLLEPDGSTASSSATFQPLEESNPPSSPALTAYSLETLERLNQACTEALKTLHQFNKQNHRDSTHSPLSSRCQALLASIQIIKQHFYNPACPIPLELTNNISIETINEEGLSHCDDRDLVAVTLDLNNRLLTTQVKILTLLSEKRSEEKTRLIQQLSTDRITQTIQIQNLRRNIAEQASALQEQRENRKNEQTFYNDFIKNTFKPILENTIRSQNSIASRLKSGFLAFLSLLSNYGKRRYENNKNKRSASKELYDFIYPSASTQPPDLTALKKHINNHQVLFFKPKRQESEANTLNKMGRLLRTNGFTK